MMWFCLHHKSGDIWYPGTLCETCFENDEAVSKRVQNALRYNGGIVLPLFENFIDHTQWHEHEVETGKECYYCGESDWPEDVDDFPDDDDLLIEVDVAPQLPNGNIRIVDDGPAPMFRAIRGVVRPATVHRYFQVPPRDDEVQVDNNAFADWVQQQVQRRNN